MDDRADNSAERHNGPTAASPFGAAVRAAYPEHGSKSLDTICDAIRDSRSSREHRKWFEKLGELYATRGYVAPRLGVTQIGFAQATHGIDHIGLTSDGLAVFEVKCYSRNPGDRGLKQLGWAHVRSRIDRMKRPGRKAAQGKNPLIAALADHLEIVRYLVHIDYGAQALTVWDVIDGPDDQPVKGRRVLEAMAEEFMGKLYALYFEQTQALTVLNTEN